MPPTLKVNPFEVILVEDHGETRVALMRLLEEMGYACASFVSVADLILSGKLASAKCLLLDIGLPVIDGLALQQSIHESRFQIPVIIFSGSSDPQQRERALLQGAVAYLEKPLRADDLKAALQKAKSTGER